MRPDQFTVRGNGQDDVRRLGAEERVIRRRTSPPGPLPFGWERRRFSGNGSGRSSSCPDLAQKPAEARDVITPDAAAGGWHLWFCTAQRR